MTLAAVQNAINQANAAAVVGQQLVPVQEAAVTRYTPPPARKFTLDDIESGQLAVDDWLKVNKDGLGLMIGKHTDLLKKIVVEIDFNEVVACKVLKFGSSPVIYRKTYDGVTVHGQTGSWDDAIELATRSDPKFRGAYPSAEVPMHVVEDIAVDGKTLAAAGQVLGHALSTTSFAEWLKFRKSLNEDEKEGRVSVEVSFARRTGNGNTWGVMTFKNLGLVE